MIKLAIVGACGRMGKRIASLASEQKEFSIVCALEQAGHPDLGKDYGTILGTDVPNVKISEMLSDSPDVLIDFTTPDSTRHWIDVCKEHHLATIIGTTGLSESDLSAIRLACQTIPIVQAPNMSVGMNLLFKLVGQVAKILGDDYDVEIVEHHHRFKKDYFPSFRFINEILFIIFTCNVLVAFLF